MAQPVTDSDRLLLLLHWVNSGLLEGKSEEWLASMILFGNGDEDRSSKCYHELATKGLIDRKASNN